MCENVCFLAIYPLSNKAKMNWKSERVCCSMDKYCPWALALVSARKTLEGGRHATKPVAEEAQYGVRRGLVGFGGGVGLWGMHIFL